MQTQWKADIDPALASPLWQGQQLTGVMLTANATTTINHGLGRALQGWFLTGISGASTIYDLQMTNPSTNKTLILHSSAAVTVSIWVF
jgi:hypothetical protein